MGKRESKKRFKLNKLKLHEARVNMKLNFYNMTEEQVYKYLTNNKGIKYATRIHKKYWQSSLYKMALQQQGMSKGDLVFIGKHGAYAECKNIINRLFALVNKVDDSRFVCWSRLQLFKVIELYLFTLINPDALNFDENGVSFSEFVNKNYDWISCAQRSLRNSILLDGFCMAISNVLCDEDSNYIMDLSDEAPEVEYVFDTLMLKGDEKKTIKTEHHDDYKKKLWESCGMYIAWILAMAHTMDKTIKDKERSVNFLKYCKTELLVNRKYSEKKLSAMSSAYNKWVACAGIDNRPPDLIEAITLFHINRYKYIIDLYLMENYEDSDFPFFRIGGVFTEMTLYRLFTENGDMLRAAIEEVDREQVNEYAEKVSEPQISDNLMIKNFGNREIDFLNGLINKIADTYVALFSKHDAEKEQERIEYKRVIKFVKEFSKDESLAKILQEYELPINLIVGGGTNYGKIYDAYKNIDFDEAD